jgi:steryl-sulfatase
MSSSLRAFKTVIFVLFFIFTDAGAGKALTEVKPPNVIVLLVDDLGYGDLSIQGNETLNTPNIDRIGKEGIRFSHWLSASSICTPSRASFMTGRYAQRYGMASSNKNTRVMAPSAPGGLPHEEVTFSEVLKNDYGYATHMSGKWHLGSASDYLPTNHGFDSFYGMGITNVQSCDPTRKIFIQNSLFEFFLMKAYFPYLIMFLTIPTSTYYFTQKKSHVFFSIVFILFNFYLGYYFTATYTLLNRDMCLLYQDKQIIQQPMELKNMTQRLTHDAISFIENNQKNNNKPFFLFMSYLKVHTALFNNVEFIGSGGDAGEYGDNIIELDWSVGEIVKTLEDLNIDDDTLIWFTSDNGPFLERGVDGGGSGFIPGGKDGKTKIWLKGGKGQQWEGGVRVPGLVRWPRKIKGHQVLHSAVSTMDIMPTSIGIIDRLMNGKLYDDDDHLYNLDRLDGKDISPILFDSPKTKSMYDQRLFLHYCGEELGAARLGNRYKVHWESAVWEDGLNSCPKESICGCDGGSVMTHDPPLLYDLINDPGENHILSPDNFPEYDNVLGKINQAVAKHKLTMPNRNTIDNQLDIFTMKNFFNQIYPCCNPPLCKCNIDHLDTTLPYDKDVHCKRGRDCFQLRLQNIKGCTKSANDWTIHGLWPQWEQKCKIIGKPSKVSLETDFNFKVGFGYDFDKKKLINNWPTCIKLKTDEQFWSHEWNKHGSCSGLSKKDYFVTALKLKDKYEDLCSGKIKVDGLKLMKRYNTKLGGEECGICFNRLLTHVVDCL